MKRSRLTIAGSVAAVALITVVVLAALILGSGSVPSQTLRVDATIEASP